MNKKLSFAIFGLFLVLAIGFTSASTLVTGVVGVLEGSSFNNVSDALVTVQCDSITKDTNSGNGTFNQGGVYAIIFDLNCTSVSVSAVKGDLSGSTTAITEPCNLGNCSTEYIAVGNPVLTAPVVTTSSGGSGGSSGSSGGSGGSSVSSFFLCGNGVCNSGETIATCPEDCDIESTNETQIEPEQDIDSNSRRGITGAVIGVVTSTGGIIVLVLIVLLGASGIYLSRKKKLSKSKSSE